MRDEADQGQDSCGLRVPPLWTLSTATTHASGARFKGHVRFSAKNSQRSWGHTPGRMRLSISQTRIQQVVVRMNLRSLVSGRSPSRGSLSKSPKTRAPQREEPAAHIGENPRRGLGSRAAQCRAQPSHSQQGGAVEWDHPLAPQGLAASNQAAQRRDRTRSKCPARQPSCHPWPTRSAACLHPRAARPTSKSAAAVGSGTGVASARSIVETNPSLGLALVRSSAICS